MPRSGDKAFSMAVNASSPPADAPIPTTGKPTFWPPPSFCARFLISITLFGFTLSALRVFFDGVIGLAALLIDDSCGTEENQLISLKRLESGIVNYRPIKDAGAEVNIRAQLKNNIPPASKIDRSSH